MKPWRINSMITGGDQQVSVQPNPEFDGVELFFHLTDDESKGSETLYLNRLEMEALINMLNSMMNYVDGKNKEEGIH